MLARTLAALPGAALLSLLALATPAAAQEPARDRDRPYPIALKVGESAAICKTRTLVCPAVGPICDDLSVATVRDGKDGLEIVAVKPGRTLCSAGTAGGLRQVFEVTVTALPAPRP